jgi:hypothetical protein
MRMRVFCIRKSNIVYCIRFFGARFAACRCALKFQVCGAIEIVPDEHFAAAIGPDDLLHLPHRHYPPAAFFCDSVIVQ